MRTYEHLVVEIHNPWQGDHIDTMMGELLDEYGEQGWELVAVDGGKFYFRRPVIEGRS